MGEIKIRDFLMHIEDATDEDTELHFNDIRKVAQLYVSIFTKPPWNDRFDYDQAGTELTEIAAYPGYVGLIAETDGKIVGFRVAHTLPDEDFEFLGDVVKRPALYGMKLGVHPDFRRRGIAKAMMQETMERAKKKGYKQVVGRTKNFEAMDPLYAKLGYKNTGVADPKHPKRIYYVLDL